MPLQIVTIPCLNDNYAYLLHDAASGETALVDIPEAAPILAELDKRGWTLSQVLITHHHADHVQGLDEVLARHKATVTGAAKDAARLPALDHQVSEGDTVTIAGEVGHVIEVWGHTIGHIAFHFPGSNVAFTADSLMALGCGRLFEGTPEMMWDSLSRLMDLPPETIICSGHEYTQANAAFAITVDPNNPDLKNRMAQIDSARAAGQPTVPSLLSVELATNPFLRAADPGVQAAVGMTGAAPVDVFAEVRKRKDNF